MAQKNLEWQELKPLPAKGGFAGMFAGVSGGRLFCMGGANFPGKLPWEGGIKTWYDGIYMLREDGNWETLDEKMPGPLGYGVSVSYKNEVIVAGGNNANDFSNAVNGYTWDGHKLRRRPYPPMPAPLANMSGAVVDHLLIVAGGSRSATGPALHICYALDLERPQQGWFELEPWPGAERLLPICTAYDGSFYLFSGERQGKTAAGATFRQILQDAYRCTLVRQDSGWKASWQTLAPMPEGMSAGASPAPVLPGNKFLFWGGVNALTALNTDHSNEHAISDHVFLYDPATDTWTYCAGSSHGSPRVTLPVVFWNGRWVYISGEIRAGVRTNSIISVKLK